MKRGNWLGILFISLLMTGCQDNEKKQTVPVGEKVQLEQLAADIHGEFETEGSLNIIKRISVDRDESIPLEIAFDLKEKGFKDFNEIASVFQDASLKYSVKPYFKLNKDETEIAVRPPKTSALSISSTNVNRNDYGTELRDWSLFPKKENEDWGNLSQYYLAIWVDLKTGEKLKEPEVIVFTINTEIEKAPKLELTINKDGLPEFSWNKVKGAKYYYVLRLQVFDDKGYNSFATIQHKTAKTKWEPGIDDSFSTYEKSEIEKMKEAEKSGEKDGKFEPDMKDWDWTTHYVVIAVNEEGTSAISNPLVREDIAHRIPQFLESAYSENEEGATLAETFEKLPSYRWVTMADGKLVQKLINYEVEHAFEEQNTFYEFNGEKGEEVTNENLTIKKEKVITIPYIVEGTHYFGQATVENYDSKTYQKELEKLKTRQDKLRNKAGSKELEVTVKDEDDDNVKSEESITYDKKDNITANSPLSKYLAINMLAGQKTISLKEFPEALDTTYLFDAWMEAIYQNPLILGAEGASVSKNGETLYVTYNIEISDMINQQITLRREVKEVVSKIIKDGMSDLEKELAINNYLVEIADYDMDALDNAEKNNFATVDEEYNHSFTPYGVLINKVGVCASYAGAFKLLADEAGLESIVVTGYLDGDLPHAWNKVKIGDEWLTLDTTNNDNDYLLNALLNVPNTASDKVLVEDERYVLDDKLTVYRSPEDKEDFEYYHLEDKYFDLEKVSDELVKVLENANNVSLRTDYKITDERFEQVLNKVTAKMSNDKIMGFYWLGVIYLEK